jgi:hypothetical protein
MYFTIIVQLRLPWHGVAGRVCAEYTASHLLCGSVLSRSHSYANLNIGNAPSQNVIFTYRHFTEITNIAISTVCIFRPGRFQQNAQCIWSNPHGLVKQKYHPPSLHKLASTTALLLRAIILLTFLHAQPRGQVKKVNLYKEKTQEIT